MFILNVFCPFIPKLDLVLRIAIIGTGGVGGYLGAKLWKTGHDLIFIARGEHLAAMRETGLRLESPDGDIQARGTFEASLDERHPCDLIIIAVKSFDTLAAAQLARPAVRENTMVMSIQNGVENEDQIGGILGPEHMIGCAAYIFSTIDRPGVVRHEGGTGKFKFGEMNDRLSDRCTGLQRTLEEAGVLGEAVGNIRQILYEKWIFICGLGGMTAFARAPIGDILANPPFRSMLREIVHEAAQVARANKIGAFEGFEEKAQAHFGRLPHGSTSSMYYDVTHEKRVEIEALNGAAVRFGRMLQIDTPANGKVYEELRRYG